MYGRKTQVYIRMNTRRAEIWSSEHRAARWQTNWHTPPKLSKHRPSHAEWIMRPDCWVTVE